MPELKRVFTSSRMNKDLDERLVPPGEYRDALNIEVSTSETADAFAIESTKGNSQITASTVFDGYTNPKCIGVARDTENDKIYWFVASDNKDAILEYDVANDIVSPVIVSVIATSDVLEFSKDKLITGINILDGLLFFTDNNSEPKKINIDRFKSASAGDFDTHTQIYGGNVTKEHVTVIKKYPNSAPNLQISNTLRSGIVDSTFKDTSGATFVVTDGSTDPIAIGTELTLTLTGRPDYKENDILKFTATDSSDIFIARVSIKEITAQTSSNITIVGIVISTTEEMLSRDNAIFNVELEEGESFFQDKFPRFAYRWRYNDNEYSAFSPFTGVAFIPDDETFVYNMDEGHNVNMVNDVRKITLNTFDTLPPDVQSVDILFKESNNNLVYVVSTLKNKETEVVITSEQIEKTVKSNQILRPYDNVPRKAKAQDITGNRLIFGNYLQNYTFDETINLKLINTPSQVDIRSPQPSAKSIRTYQLGIVYIDEFGRKSPVFTNTGAALFVDGTNASKKNILSAQVKSDAPTWATHYQYYIKENSNEYYNVIMDKYYAGEEANFWISFPSSERNKITLETYLILKKQNAKDAAFNPDNYGLKQKKYKVLDISDAVPEFISKKKTLIGDLINSSGALFPNTSVGHPRINHRSFRIAGDIIGIDASQLRDITSNANFINQNKYIKITEENGLRSTKFYQIESVTKVDAGSGTDYNDSDDYYEFTLVKPFDSDINWIGTNNNRVTGLKLEVYVEEDVSDLEDFAGRFFVKLKRDDIIAENIFGESKDEFDQMAEAPFKLIDFNDTTAASKTLTSFQASGTSGTIHSDHAKRNNFVGGGFVIEHDLDKDGNKPTSTVAAGTTAFKTTFDKNEESAALASTAVGPKKGNKKLILRYIDYGEDVDGGDTISPKQQDFNLKASRQDDFNFHAVLKDPRGLYLSFAADTKERKLKIQDVNITAVKNYSATRHKKLSSNRGIRYQITLADPIAYSPLASATDGVAANAHDGGSLKTNTFFLDENLNKKITNRNTESIKLWRKRDTQQEKKTGNPAVWETEPIKEKTDLDLYYEASDVYAVANHGTQQNLGSNRNDAKTWFNCFSFGNGVESDRIRDDFNGTTIDKGPIASTVLDEPYAEERRATGLIYSGLFNSKVGLNDTNQFIIAEKITKDLNNVYGSIQKIHQRDNDLVVFCEDKVLRVLANKDALFNADGNAQLISTDRVLGQAVPYAGDYGISKNPESFADYAFRSYFSDKDRGKVFRLSLDGVTDISGKGMGDYFSDNLSAASSVLGSYDEDTGAYNITLNDNTVSFKEAVDGWPSRKSFIPEFGISLNNTYYTFKNAHLYEHTNDVNKNTFYGAAQNDSTVDLIFNNNSGSIKKFKTLNYEGDTGWVATDLTTDQETGGDVSFKAKENKYFAALKHNKKLTTTVSVSNGDNGNIIIPDSQSTTDVFGATMSDSFTFVVKPNPGNKFSSTFTFGSYNTDVLNAPSAAINSDGNMEVTITLKGFKMPASDITVDVPLVTSGKVSAKTYTLGGTFSKTLSNAVISDFEGGGLINAASADGSSWTTTGSANANVTLLNILVSPQINHAFTAQNLPRLTVTGVVNDNYQITGPTLVGTNSYKFKVVGSIVNQDLTNENIKIFASPDKSVDLLTNAIWGADISTVDITKDIEEREIIIYGSVGAKVNLNASASSASGTDLKIDKLDGNGFTAAQKEITIGSDGKATAVIEITANTTGANRNIFVRLSEVTNFVITDELDNSDGSDNAAVLFTIVQTNEVQLTFDMGNFPTNVENLIASGLSSTINESIGANSSDTFTSLAGTENPEVNNKGKVTYTAARTASPDTTSLMEKVDDLDITNDFLNSSNANPYDATTGNLILTNGTEVQITNHTMNVTGNSARAGVQVDFEVIKYGSDDDVLRLNTANLFNLSAALGGGTASSNTAVALTGATLINSSINELTGSIFGTRSDDEAIIFQFEVTFLAAAAGKYPSELEIVYGSLSSNIDNNTSDTSLLLNPGMGDQYGRIQEGDTATAVFRVLANGAISGGTAVTATVTVQIKE